MNLYLEGDPIEALQERQRTFDQHVMMAMNPRLSDRVRQLNRRAALEVQEQIQAIIMNTCVQDALNWEAAKRALEDA